LLIFILNKIMTEINKYLNFKINKTINSKTRNTAKDGFPICQALKDNNSGH
jgi:hypothetical protein